MTVTPIHKADDRHCAANYRPITITSVLCRLLEKVIKEQFYHHLHQANLLPDEQHGFRTGRSCLTNLLETYEDITKLVDQGLPVDEVFLDFAKAFDKVPHQRLLIKLQKLGIGGSLLNWIESFLSNRFQQVEIRGSLSKLVRVLSGVPQGSVLGPLLFIAYILDLPENIRNCYCKIFADDTKIYRVVASSSDVKVLQKDIDSLSSWCDKWCMLFNVKKCYVMHYGKNNAKALYHIRGDSLEMSETYKDLGVLVSNDLKVSQQVTKCVSKANSVLGMIRRTFSYIDKDILLQTYKVYVRPILEYCQQVWCPYLSKDINEIEKVQRRATKLLVELSDKCYEERLQALGLYSLAERRVRGDMIHMFKLCKGILDINPRKFFTFATDTSNRAIRGHIYHVKHQETPHGSIRKYFYSQRIITPWNNLPSELMLCKSVEEFKHKYDKLVLQL